MDAPLQPALWGVYRNNIQQGDVTISASGVAECGAGVAGTYSILAYAPADPSIPLTNSGLLTAKKAVVGMAQLTCP